MVINQLDGHAGFWRPIVAQAASSAFDFDSPAIYSRERREPKPLAAAHAAAWAAAGGDVAGFPGAEAPGYGKPQLRSKYLVCDHNRRAIETLTPDQIIYSMTINSTDQLKTAGGKMAGTKFFRKDAIRAIFALIVLITKWTLARGGIL